MPVYQTEVSQLAESIASLLITAPEDSEIHIGLDGPLSNEGLQLLAKMEKNHGFSRLRVTHFPRQGLVATLNGLIERSDCRYLARQDSDDICLPNRLKQQWMALEERPTYGFCGTQITRCDERLYPNQRQRFYPKSFQAQLAYASLLNNPIAHPTLMIRRELIKNIGYRPIAGAEDWDLYIRLWQEGQRSFNLDISGILYRMHPRQITKQTRDNQILHSLKKRSLQAATAHYRWSQILKPIQALSNTFQLTELGIKAKFILDR